MPSRDGQPADLLRQAILIKIVHTLNLSGFFPLVVPPLILVVTLLSTPQWQTPVSDISASQRQVSLKF